MSTSTLEGLSVTDPTSLADIAAAAPHVQNILGALTGLVAIIMSFGIGMLAVWLDYRKKRDIFQLHHAERMAGIEKGIEVPPLPPEFFQANRRGLRTPPEYLRRGLLWLLIGAAGTVALYFQSGPHQQALWGLVLIAWGVANLLFYALDGRRKASAAPGTTVLSDQQSNTHL
jgi:Domain of unknown function (DUF6249)